jgi:RND family efflux transporter MFP subunit
MKAMKPGAPAGLVLVLVLALAAAACGGGDAQETDAEHGPRQLVLQASDVAQVEEMPLASGVLLTGTLNPAQVVEVRAQVPGLVTRLAVDRGDVVRAGQLLAVIDAEGIRSAAAGAQAQVSAAQANLAVALQRLESSRKLFEKGAISEIDMKTAQAGYEAAGGQLAAARAQAAAAGESARRASVASPIGGEVSLRHISQGEAVSPGDPLLTVVNATELELSGQIPVQQAANVRPGQRVEFTLDAYPGQKLEGSVARVEPTADPATRQVGVYLRLANTGRRIVGGLFATGRVLTGNADSVLSVPAAALRQDGTGTFVYVIEQNRLVRRDVVVGVTDPVSGRVQIVSGVRRGERVLGVPGEVEPNTPVRLAGSGAAAAKAAAEQSAGADQSGHAASGRLRSGAESPPRPAREQE